jgi:RNA polymerase sigma factor for flagellar operon FliA
MRRASRTIDSLSRLDADAIEAALPLVRHIARTLRARYSRHADLDDLMSVGSVGLMEAAQRFDATRGTTFCQYASARVSGAILDYIREELPMSRASYAAVRAGQTHRYRSHPEPLDGMGIGTLAAATPATDAAAIANEQRAQLLARLRRVLSPRERAIVVARHVLDRKVARVALEHGISVARICQLDARALRKLRVPEPPPMVMASCPAGAQKGTA